MRLYYLRHGFESFDPTMSLFLSVFGFMALEDLKRTDLDAERAETFQSSVILAVKGMHDQAYNCHLGRIIYQLLRSGLAPNEAKLLEQIAVNDKTQLDDALILQHVRSSLPVTIVNAIDEVDSKRVDHMVKELAGLDLDSEEDQSSEEQTPV